MTTVAPPSACPACAAPLTGAAACPTCALPLTGPLAARLWEVEVELGRLDARREVLLAERRTLLARLRSTVAPLTAASPSSALPGPRPVPAPREEWTPQRVQNLLLVLGGVLLAVAATVFAAVTYDRLGVGGRAAVLLALTAAAAGAAPRLRARGLGATAETLSAVALALAALDAWGLRRLGVGDGLSGVAFAATTSGVLAALSGAYAGVVGLRLPRAAAVGLGNLALLLAVVELQPDPVPAAVLLALVAGLDLGLVAALRGGPRSEPVRDVTRASGVAAAVLAVPAAVAALVAVVLEGPPAAVAVGALAALAAGAAVLGRGLLRAGASGVATVLAVVAAVVALSALTDERPLVAAVVAGALAAAALLLPRAERRGPVTGALVVSVLAVAAVAEPVVAALLGPLAWAADPWTLPAGDSARGALSPLRAWHGSEWTPAVLLAAGGAAAAGCGALRSRLLGNGAAALGLASLLVLPVVLDVPHAVALLSLLVLAASLVAAGQARATASLTAAAAAPAGLAAAWSLADQGTTLAVLPVTAALAALVAARSRGATAATGAGLAGLLLGAELAAAGAAAGLVAEQVGGLLLLAPAGLLAASALLEGTRRTALHAATAALTVVAVGLAAADPGWLSWTLAGSGVLALAAALSADRRPLAPLGALLLTASSWVRLAQADVDAPEPYVLPLAALALLLGHLRARRDAGVGSRAAYGPGLALLLGPSVLAALAEDGLARPLLVGTAGLAVLLVGARLRLQAPLVAGGGALAVVALDLLAPYAAAVPRWTALAAAGTLLVVVGATFEQRRRELADLRDRVAALR